MNANELADLLADSNDPDIRRAVAMLRQFELAESIIKQQQVEIEALKEKNKWLEGKCLVVKELDDSQYPFRAILRKTQEK